MTIITGHNQIIQHAGKAQELAQQSQSPKPSPEAAVPVQQAREIQERSTVQSSEEASSLGKKREGKGSGKDDDQKKRKNVRTQDPHEQDPDAPGRLLDTII